MRAHQTARALTLSVALAAIGLIAAPAPASAAEEVREVKSRVKVTFSVTNHVRSVFMYAT